MASISSANVACGFHAGDPGAMRATIALAKAQRRRGRAPIPASLTWSASAAARSRRRPQEVEDFVLYQVAALAGMAAAQGVRLQHVKAHGALYNMACRDRALADAIARAVAAFDKNLILFGLPNSELIRAGQAAGLAGGGRSLCRSRLRARWLAGLTPKGRQRDSRQLRRSSRARSGWSASGRVVAIDGSDDRARRRHDLPARRHAGGRRTGARGSPGPGSSRHHDPEPQVAAAEEPARND